MCSNLPPQATAGAEVYVGNVLFASVPPVAWLPLFCTTGAVSIGLSSALPRIPFSDDLASPGGKYECSAAVWRFRFLLWMA